MSADEMIADLSTACGACARRHAQGHLASLVCYKLYDADSGIPVNCLLTVASHQDNQAPIPQIALNVLNS